MGRVNWLSVTALLFVILAFVAIIVDRTDVSYTCAFAGIVTAILSHHK